LVRSERRSGLKRARLVAGSDRALAGQADPPRRPASRTALVEEPTSGAPGGGRPAQHGVEPGPRRRRSRAAGAWTTSLLPRLQRLGRRLTCGLTRKFRLFVIVLLTTLTATLTAITTLAEEQAAEDRLRQRATDLATVLAGFAAGRRAEPQLAELRRLLVQVTRAEDVLYAYVLDPAGRRIADGDPRHAGRRPLDDPLGREARALRIRRLMRDARGLHVAEPVDFVTVQAGVVRFGLSTAAMEHDIAAHTRRNLAIGLLFLGLGLLFGLPLVRRITRPLAQLTESTEAVSRGQLDRRITLRTNDELERLAAAFNRMLSQLNESLAQVRRLAYFDSVTELPNRIQFRQLLARALAEARRHGRRGAVLFLDLDRFKLINDSFGHDAGDRLLQAFARRLAACLRGTDVLARGAGDGPTSTAARLGGDEFTVLLGEIHQAQDDARVAERVLAALDHPFEIGGHAAVVGASIGIALFPDDGADAETLLKNADMAMFHAKAQGRNNFKFYRSDLGVRAVARLTLEHELRSALERDELELHYQPQIEPRSGAVRAMEALLRWQHPRLGSVPASTILALAEDAGLMVPIGSWALRRACAAARSWPESSAPPPCVAVNLSAVQILQEDFALRLGGVLETSGLPAERLELEIAETAVVIEPEVMAARMAALRRLGVGLAIDDFGAGPSTLGALRRFRPDRLKIGRALIHDIDHDVDAAAIVSAIIALAASLGVEVAAAGVETECQADLLRRQGCHRLQGSLFSAPLAPAGVAPWLLRRHGRAERDASAGSVG
jgi:diguanylate cyclase (GGDEF)-like protein